VGAPILSADATLQCPHGGKVSIASTNTRVNVGAAATTVADTFSIAGCSFTVGPKPQPCVRVQWTQPATRVRVNHQPVILSNSSGVCLSAESIPQGPPTVVTTQARVSAV
jgi:hypothetical protein